MAGTEFVMSYRSRYAEAVSRMLKTKMETEIQAYIESILRKRSGKRVA
jgi:hypothetical protein